MIEPTEGELTAKLLSDEEAAQICLGQSAGEHADEPQQDENTNLVKRTLTTNQQGGTRMMLMHAYKASCL